MNPADLLKINYNSQLIVDDVDSRHIVDHLISKGVLDIDDDEEIRAERTRKDKIELLLDKVTSDEAGPNAYKYFRESLGPNYQHIVIKLDSTPMDAGNVRREGATYRTGGNMDMKFAEGNKKSTKSIEITGSHNMVLMSEQGGSINFYNGRKAKDFM